MNHKEDFFRSPVPRNPEHLYSVYVKQRTEDEPLCEQNLFSPLNHHPESPFSRYSPGAESAQIKTKEQQELNRPPNARLISDKIIFQDSAEQEEAPITPKKNTEKVCNMLTTPRKKYDLRFIEHTEKQHFGKDSQKGLRGLSKQAYEILCHSEPMTYQEVAGKIIEQNDEIGQYSDKDKQSIKRRVYDALNVLIAVGIMDKCGKKISMSQRKQSHHKKLQEEKQVALQKYGDRKLTLGMKKRQLKKLLLQQQQLGKLTKRNQKFGSNFSDRICFPFLVVSHVSEGGSQLFCRGIRELKCADLDAICKLSWPEQL